MFDICSRTTELSDIIPIRNLSLNDSRCTSPSSSMCCTYMGVMGLRTPDLESSCGTPDVEREDKGEDGNCDHNEVSC